MPPLRILVVDDELCIRHILSSFLRLDGHDVETAVDGRDALEKFSVGQWDLVITDRAMPRMNGEELAVAVKARAPGVPVVMVTGLRSAIQQPIGSGGPIDVVVQKPFTSANLRNAVQEALTGCREHDSAPAEPLHLAA
jgi:DNA-binding response OmpR family regulator